jgi:hypothetical protein
VETCDVCGFEWASVPIVTVAGRVRAGTSRLAEVALSHDALGGRRPEPTCWSVAEYTGHVRDVLLHVRDRVVIGLVEDTPDFKPLYRDQRVDFGLYEGDDVNVAVTDMLAAADLFARTFERLSEAAAARPVRYVYPVDAIRTIGWMGQQVVHEVEHHLGDVEAILAGLSA